MQSVSKTDCPDERSFEFEPPDHVTVVGRRSDPRWTVEIQAAYPPLEWDPRTPSCTVRQGDRLCAWYWRDYRRAVILRIVRTEIDRASNTIYEKRYALYLVWEYSPPNVQVGFGGLCVGPYDGQDLSLLCENARLRNVVTTIPHPSLGLVPTGRLTEEATTHISHKLCVHCEHSITISLHVSRICSTLAIRFGSQGPLVHSKWSCGPEGPVRQFASRCWRRLMRSLPRADQDLRTVVYAREWARVPEYTMCLLPFDNFASVGDGLVVPKPREASSDGD
jgi:hypothetical protein